MKPFDWRVALVRWLVGALSGLGAGIGEGIDGAGLWRPFAVGLITAAVVDLGAWANAQREDEG